MSKYRITRVSKLWMSPSGQDYPYSYQAQVYKGWWRGWQNIGYSSILEKFARESLEEYKAKLLEPIVVYEE